MDKDSVKFGEGELVLMAAAAFIGDLALVLFGISLLIFILIIIGVTWGPLLFFTMPAVNLLIVVGLTGWNIWKFKDLANKLKEMAEKANVDPAKMLVLAGPQLILFLGLGLGLIFPIKTLTVLLVGLMTNTKIGKLLTEVAAQAALAVATGGASAATVAKTAAERLGKQAGRGLMEGAKGAITGMSQGVGGENGSIPGEQEGGSGGGGRLLNGVGRFGRRSANRSEKENEGQEKEKPAELSDWESNILQREKPKGMLPQEVVESFSKIPELEEQKFNETREMLPGITRITKPTNGIITDGNTVDARKAA